MASRRSIPRPSMSGQDTGPKFVSPYRPPAGVVDLFADEEHDEDSDNPYRYTTDIGGYTYRHRRVPPNGLKLFLAAISPYTDNKIQVRQLSSFISRHLHPDDNAEFLMRSVDPDTGFSVKQLNQLVEGIAKAGTARPFGLSGNSRAQRRASGERSGRSLH